MFLLCTFVSSYILQGSNIDSVTFSEIGVNIGGRICEIISILPTEVTGITNF